MAQQPTEGDIDMFMSMVPGITRSEIIARLKGNNNNVEQAVGEYFDSPDSGTKYRYDESQFHSDREGLINSHGVSFEVQGPDEFGPAGPSGRFDGAMSRPPSPAIRNKSPLGKVIDLTAEHAAADPKNSMSWQDHENQMQDNELQQALAASRLDAGLPPQESGITRTDQPCFGPATRNQYEQGKWDMVPLFKSSTHEVLPDPDPADRKRDPNVPAFLRPNVEDDRLGALITMYHEIPMIHEIFVNENDLLATYGHNPEWWKGASIEMPGVATGSEYVESEADRELQRLMAFLDKTERSYGSAEPLANTDNVQRSKSMSRSIEAAVLEAWRQIYLGQDVTGRLFSRGVPSEEEQDGVEAQDFAILELTLPKKESYHETIYDIADELLWPNLGSENVTESPYLSHVADVMVFKIEGNDLHKQIEVPAVWYPNRYLLENREEAFRMRMAKFEVVQKMERIAMMQERLTIFRARNGKIVNVQDLLKASLRHDEAELQSVAETDQANAGTDRSSVSTHAQGLSAKLHKLAASIEAKLQSLNLEKEKTLESMRRLSQLYTKPSHEPGSLELTEYTLRGVSTTRNTTYICRRAEVDLIDMHQDGDEPRARDQWWKIDYATSGSRNATVEKTTEDKVLEAARTESKNILLVYASQEAMNFAQKPLPIALERFVQFDNKLFKSEFSYGPSTPSHTDEVKTPVSSPGKRKRFEDSRESTPNNDEQPPVYEREASSQVDDPEEKHEVIIGIDPSASLSSGTDPDGKGQEMRERGSLPMVIRRRLSKAETEGGGGLGTNSQMDLDRVVEDARAAEESAAVRNVVI